MGALCPQDPMRPGPLKIPVSVLVVIHTPALEVLMIRRADGGEHWQCVTGSRDATDADLHHTAWREVGEETGIACGPGTVLHPALLPWGLTNTYEIWPQWRHRYPPEVTHNTEHLFSLCVPVGTPVRLNPREHTDHRWLSWREAADACFSPSNAEAILLLPQWAA